MFIESFQRHAQYSRFILGYIYAKKSKIEPSFMSREGSVKLEALLRKKERKKPFTRWNHKEK